MLDRERITAAWIGEKPTLPSICAILLVGTVGFVICGVQPVVLGALVSEHRLTNEGIGWASTVEFLTIGGAIAIAAAWLRPRRLRTIAFVGALITGIADLAMFNESGTLILLNRAISGAGEGLLIWITACMVARSSEPVRWAAIFVTMQGLAQLAFATVMPLTLMARSGANGGFAGLAVAAALAVLAVPFLPKEMADLPSTEHRYANALTTPSSILVLVTVFLIAAFSIGLFVYLAPLALQAGLTSIQLSYVISLALVGANVGSMLAIFFPRVPYYPIFAISVVVNAAILAMLFALPGFWVFAFAAFLYSVFWLFFLPYQVPMAIEADPTRRVAVSLPGAQLLGAAAGPFLCSFAVTNTESRGALVVAGVCFAVAFAIATAMLIRHRPRHQNREGVRLDK
jgi:hypothetical protein